MVIEGATPCKATSYFDFKTDANFASETFYVHSGSGDCLSGGLLEGTYILLADNETIHLTISSSALVVFKIKEISTTDLLLGSLDADGAEAGEFVFTR
ncbi:hypothetical protein [Lacinutrix sp. MEBiC02404]